MEQIKYYLGFSLFQGIGPKRFLNLIEEFKTAEKAWFASVKELKQVNLPLNLIKRFIDFREKINLDKYKKKLEKDGIEYLSLSSSQYPFLLKQINNPPIGLFIRGQIKRKDQKAIAVIGTRKMTSYGRKVIRILVPKLVDQGYTIVSGLARGCDGEAHKNALGKKGRTIAVLGSGLNNLYPPEHKVLAENIIAKNQGALVSEFPPKAQPRKGNFLMRNRIVSGMSKGVLVIEGASKSGTKNTTRWAADQGREVFAVPGPITSKMSQAPADLIKLGAKLVTGLEDILEEV
jgi:DNA processing protein